MAKYEFEWMKGRTFLNDGKQITIAKISRDVDDYKLTDEKNQVSFVTAAELKKDFQPIDEGNKNGTALATRAIASTNADLDKLTQGLFNAFDKLGADGGEKYIAQATAMNETAENIINIKRTQLEAVKLVVGNRK
jgi:hypothetical protein